MQLSQHSAQQIVEEIGQLVKQNINLMDDTGHIIASTDPKRIGNFHEGAHRIISERLPELYITPEMETPMVRRGVNLPIEIDGNVVGVVGITGGYDEVFAYGQIVKKMTQILIRERRELDQQRLDDRVRSRFLEDWVLGSGLSNPQSLSDRGFALGIDIRAPRRVMVVSIRDLTEHTGSLEGQLLIEQVEETVKTCCARRPGTMILRNAARQILLLPRRGCEEPENLARQITDAVGKKHGVSLLAGIDGGAADLHTAYLQANRAWRIAARRKDRVVCYESLGAELILDDVPLVRKVEYLHKMFPGMSVGEMRDAVTLLAAYFTLDGSLSAAAEHLFIHKNTLQYRLRRLAEETGRDVRHPSQSPALYLAILFFWDLENEPEALDLLHQPMG